MNRQGVCDRDPNEFARQRTGWARAHVSLLAAIFMLVAASGCARLLGESIAWEDSEPPLLVHRTEGGHDAQVVGRLRYLADEDCFVLETESGESWHVPAWPPGSEPFEEDGEVTGIDVRGFGEVPVGGRLTGAGGYLNPETSDREIPDNAMDCSRGEHAGLALIDEITAVTEAP